MKKHFKISDDIYSQFLKSYKDCDGDYKKLRTVASGEEKPTWDIVRNKHLTDLLKKVDDDDLDLWNSDELPTKIHTELIMWAYSPDASKIKKQLSSLQEKLEKYATDDENDKEKNGKNSGKRKSGEISSKREEDSDEDDESPKKKKTS